MRDIGIALKLALLILPITIAIFLFILGYYYNISKNTIVNNVEENSKNLALNSVNKIEKSLKSFEIVAQELSYFAGRSELGKEEILSLIENTVQRNKDIYGSTIAFEPYGFDKNSLYFAPYYFRGKNNINFTYLGGDSYNYFAWDWYKLPKEENKALWSEPYYDKGGGEIVMSTYSVPFYNESGKPRQFRGVVTADISLSWLSGIVESLNIAKSGYGFLISKTGKFITHPESGLIMNESIFSIAENKNSQDLKELGNKMISGESGFELTSGILSDKKYWIYYLPLPSNGWSLGVMFPEQEIMADINSLSKDAVLISIEGILILLLVIIYISRSITRPLRQLSEATKDIASGNLEFDIPRIKSQDEVGRLSKSFEYMKFSLKKYISDLQQTTAARQRIESELKIARDIQMGIIPKNFPPFPNRNEFEIYAFIEPAREVGGDFYDFFFLDDNKLFFMIGDVSDKGIPASLFMAVTKTLIKAVIKTDKDLGEIIYRINNELCFDNETSMFVSIFFGIIDLRNGEITYTNAGHNVPLIKNSGTVSLLEKTEGMALGAFENANYSTNKVKLDNNDIIFLYTDGVTEAVNENGDLFEEQNLIDKLRGYSGLGSKEIIEQVDKDIKEFVGSEPQSDDITMLSIKYLKRPEIMLEIELKNDVSQLQILHDNIERFWIEYDLDAEKMCHINLSLEEIITNIIKYGYEDNLEHKIRVTIKLDDKRNIQMEVIDDGNEFNPFDHPEPDTTKPLEQRDIGGLGIHLVRNCMDYYNYQRVDNLNKIVLIKNIG
ncbi:MAG: SpoIIE family protein phosphatase [Candidatus Dadabacteria bacterium]|nr:SpoIIE family protein phosphatase [Candidatus Dadabacteria bacterium]NIX14830.1 SpoIIE family protein phosphatase [Candidatus Dadabacteria bacterium]NIY21456.1 SpoIIE family protein phosphatase [Candidatus Dadabacteria bacterium]